jgi:hypothetical protein
MSVWLWRGDAQLPCAEFTLTAWVDVLPTVDFAVVKRIPLLRKPMQTDPSLTCWGWFHAPEFRFGAHGTFFVIFLMIITCPSSVVCM